MSNNSNDYEDDDDFIEDDDFDFTEDDDDTDKDDIDDEDPNDNGDDPTKDTDKDEETVTLKKSDFKKLDRKARAYDATKPNKAEIKSQKKQLPTKQGRDNNQGVSEEQYDRINLRLDGYTPDEVDQIMELGGPSKLKSPIVQQAIRSMRKQKERKNAEPSAGQRSPVFKKFTQEDLSKMSVSELEKILPHG